MLNNVFCLEVFLLTIIMLNDDQFLFLNTARHFLIVLLIPIMVAIYCIVGLLWYVNLVNRIDF